MSSCVQIDNVVVAPLASQPLMVVVNPNSHTWRSEFNEQFEAVTFSWYPDSDSPVLNLNTPSLELPIRNTNIPIELYSTSRLQSFEMVRDEEEIVSSFESSDVDTRKDCVDMFGNGMDGVAVVSPEQECKRVGEVMPSIDLGSTSISNRDCADAAYVLKLEFLSLSNLSCFCVFHSVWRISPSPRMATQVSRTKFSK